MGETPFYHFISSTAALDPVKTVFLCVPDSEAATVADVAAFATISGWIDQVERDGSLLIAPLAADGWAAEPIDLLKQLYLEHRNAFSAPSGRAIPGRPGGVWAWEPLIHVVGYAEGAKFAGNSLLAHPNFAASCVLVDGRPDDFAAAEEASDHWLVPSPSTGYGARNRDIPVAVWLFGDDPDGGAAAAHFREVNRAVEVGEQTFLGQRTQVLCNPDEPAWQVRRTPGLKGRDPAIAPLAMREFLNHVVRWKNSPDGTLAWHISKREFGEGRRYRHFSVRSGDHTYPCAVHLPSGMSRQEAAGLPLVLSLHGRGEPAWLFAEKNGWEALADETRAFMVALPDSPENRWTFDRDEHVLELLLERLVADFAADATRVYVTGFSNGAVFACQQASTRPHLFAAASPWNGPGIEAARAGGLDSFVLADGFAASGYVLPFWICVGDADDKAPVERPEELDAVLAVNGCSRERVQRWDAGNRYHADWGYRDGSRMATSAFTDRAGSLRVGFTVMKDMPHGAIADEARATWEFVRRFRRPPGAKQVEEIEP
jgi:poly(3-hydroxybutyrate) depolymerase